LITNDDVEMKGFLVGSTSDDFYSNGINKAKCNKTFSK
jgi:hypothetical protein